MGNLNHLAARVFNTPLMISQAKLDTVLAVLGPRMGLDAAALPMLPMLPEPPDEPDDRAVPSPDGIAIISVCGPLVKRASGGALSGGPTTYAQIEDCFLEAATDPSIKGILFDFDSPGGECSGVFELADLIYAQRGGKPIWAIANDDCASAAYELASACDRLYITQTGAMGSVGVIAMHVDQSGLDSKLGVKYTPIYAGDRKIDLNSHLPLSTEAYTIIKAEVDRLDSMFVASVARNRKMAPAAVKAMQAGLCFGVNAVSAGLADAVGTMRDALADLSAAVSPRLPGTATAVTGFFSRKENMTETIQAVAPAAQPQTIPIDAHAAAVEIAELCALVGKPELTTGFLTARKSPADVRHELAALRAASDGPDIRSTVAPDNGGAPTEKPKKRLAEVMAEMVKGR